MATKKQIEKSEALAYLCEWSDELLEPSSVLELSTEYMRNQQTDYVSVKLYYQRDGVGHVADLGYNVGKALGYRFRRNTHQLALGGGGYSKSYEVLTNVLSALGIDRKDVNYRY